MIPKIIHYCWVGPRPKSEGILSSIESWSRLNPDFEIKLWNETNFPIDDFPFTRKMYREKRWAFVADYIRLHVLKEHGGVYLDADMYLLQSLSPLLDALCVLGEEAPGTISAGMVAAVAHHPYISACKKFYDENPNILMTIPRILTKIYDEFDAKDAIVVYPPKTFYPFDAAHIKSWHGQYLGPDVYGVHLWEHSWGSPLNKLLKKVGVHRIGTKVAEMLGIKQILKKILGFI